MSKDLNFTSEMLQRSQTTDFRFGLHEYPIAILLDTTVVPTPY
jgi:hypothetical protein